MNTAAITRAFEDRSSELPGSADQHALRRRALERFDNLGLPGRRIETWHYTDLSPFADRGFDFIVPPPDADAMARAERLLAARAPIDSGSRLVFVDGHRIESLSTIESDAGVELRPLPLEQAGFDGDSALTALNTAFLADGADLRVHGRIRKPIELVFIGTGRKLATQFRLSVALAAGAEATVLLGFVDVPDAGEGWLNLVADLTLAESSELTLHRLQTHGDSQDHTALHRVTLAREAKLAAGSIELGGRLARNEFEIALDGTSAEARLFGLELTRGKQHCDTRIEIDHRAESTTSRQDYRAIAADSSRSVFNGKVIVREQAQHIDARQRNDNLLLSRKAEVDTKPELEIYADQVICSHGATVGELDEEHLFYLRARGIDAETARGILTSAFAETILERFAHEGFRELAREEVDSRLPRSIDVG